MRKIIAIVLSMIMLICIGTTFADEYKKDNLYENEIIFQGIPWGKNEKDVRETLVKSGFADSNVTFGWNTPAQIWQEHESDIIKGLYTLRTNVGGTKIAGYITGVKPLKMVGGHELRSVELTYLPSIIDGKIIENAQQLMAVSLSFSILSSEETMPLFVDLLKKLEKQYGSFELYVNKNAFRKNYTSILEMTGKSEVIDTDQGKICAVKHGQNNTALMLIIHNNVLKLIYAKTDAYVLANELIKIIDAQKAGMEDAGL